MLSPCSIQKELAKGQSIPEPKTMMTRAKVGSKRKKSMESEDDAFEVERQFHEFVIEKFAHVKAHHEKSLSEMEENLVGLRSIVAAKDNTISKLEKDVKALKKQLFMAEMETNKAVMEAIDEAKVFVTCTVLQTLLHLGGEVEPEPVKAADARSSGAKEMAGGAGGEAGGDEVADGEVAIVGYEGC
ncbi:hypothetical protein HanPI659440_Chr17g0679781 [Helianthus annuus]|nr:hypothetical protein HanPI659440_Chr17g0679781 [Helianthus annuus]